MSRKAYQNRSCPACVRPVRSGDDCWNCDACRLSYHVACWLQRGGCIAPECPNASPNQQAADAPATEDEIDPAGQIPTAAQHERPVPVLTHESPRSPDSEPGGALIDRIPRGWLSPTGIATYAAVLMLMLTTAATAWKIQQKRAKRDFEQVVRAAQTGENPRVAVELYDEYIRQHPVNALTRRARQLMENAVAGVPEYDFGVAMQAADEAGDDYDAVEHIVGSYLSTHPPSSYREKATRRIEQLSRLRQEQEYEQIERALSGRAADQERRRADLEEFIVRYPQGDLTDIARKDLAAVAVAIEQQALIELQDKVKIVTDAGDFENALALLDSAQDRLFTGDRNDALPPMREKILVAREESDAAAVLCMPTNSIEEKALAAKQCRFFLLLYPESRNAATIRDLQQRIQGERVAHDWAAIRKDIDLMGDQPERAIALLDTFTRWHAEGRPQSVQELALPHHLALFKRSVDELDDLEAGTIVTTDGEMKTGRIEKRGSMYRVLDPATSRRIATISWNQIEMVRLHPGPGSYDGLMSDIAAMAVGEVCLDDVHRIVEIAGRNGLTQLELRARSLMLAMNPEDEVSKKTLMSAGWQLFNGRWIPSAQVTPDRRAAEIVEQFRKLITTEVRTLVEQLDLHFTYRQLGVTKKLPLELFAGFERLDIISIVQDEISMVADVRLHHAVKMRLASQDGQIPEGITSETLRSSAEKLQCYVDLEIRESAPNMIGAEIERCDNGECRFTSIAKGGPADSAWIEVGDELLAIDAVSIRNEVKVKDLYDRFKSLPPSEMELTLRRSGREFNVTITPAQPNSTSIEARYRICHDIGQDGQLLTGAWTKLSPEYE